MTATQALWIKAWRDTRWRFLVGAGLMVCSAAATVLAYPRVLELLPMVSGSARGELGRRVLEAAELVRSYRGYLWSQAWRTNLPNLVTLFAVLLGAAGFPAKATPDAGVLFTLALPVSRRRLLGVRIALGLAELGALCLLPALVLPLLSPAVGAACGVGDALLHAACLFVPATGFFGLALLLSLAFDDPWRPLLLALAAALALGALPDASPTWNVFQVMSGEAFFRTGRLPWAGLLAAASVSAALCFAASSKLERRDF